jgi:anti-sigma factor RsiW
MTPPRNPIGDDELQAFVDGRLSPLRTAAFEAYVADHPEVGRRVASYRKQRDALRAALQFKADESIPPHLQPGAPTAARRQPRGLRMKALAASIVLILGGAAIGWLEWDSAFLESWLPESATRWDEMAKQAVAAHLTFARDQAHPVEIPASDEAMLQRRIAEHLGRGFPIPDLAQYGFQLIGGRVLSVEAGPAAQLVYNDDRGDRVTVYIHVGDRGETTFRSITEGDVQALYWVDDGCGYVVSGQLDRGRLQQIAELVFRQFEQAT